MIRSCPGRSLRRSRSFLGMTTWNLGETLTVCISFFLREVYRLNYRMSRGLSIVNSYYDHGVAFVENQNSKCRRRPVREYCVKGRRNGYGLGSSLTIPISRGRRPRSVAPNPVYMFPSGADCLNG